MQEQCHAFIYNSLIFPDRLHTIFYVQLCMLYNGQFHHAETGHQLVICVSYSAPADSFTASLRVLLGTVLCVSFSSSRCVSLSPWALFSSVSFPPKEEESPFISSPTLQPSSLSVSELSSLKESSSDSLCLWSSSVSQVFLGGSPTTGRKSIFVDTAVVLPSSSVCVAGRVILRLNISRKAVRF